MEAMQPHCWQSGLPPNWQGVILVERSAETVIVVRAKIHASGLFGGEEISFITISGISRTGYCFRSLCNSTTVAALWAGVSISGSVAPRCGVNRLNQTFVTAGCVLQNWRNWSRYPGRSAICAVMVL